MGVMMSRRATARKKARQQPAVNAAAKPEPVQAQDKPAAVKTKKKTKKKAG